MYAEILDPAEPAPAADPLPRAEVTFTDRRLDGAFGGEHAGVLVLDADGDGRADLLAWSAAGLPIEKETHEAPTSGA